MKKVYRLEGLDCANCADQIQEETRKKLQADFVHVNFVTKKISFEVEEDEGVTEYLEKIVHKYEPSVRVEEVDASKEKAEKLILQGLDCGNCAATIERKVAGLEEIEEAWVDLVSKSLKYIEKPGVKHEKVLEKIKKIVRDVEPGVEVRQKEDIVVEERDYSQEIRILLGGGLFALGLLSNFTPGVEFVIFLMAYLISGYEVLLDAAKGISKGHFFGEEFLMSIATLGAFAIGEYPEGVAVMLFYLVGELFQSRAVNQSRKSIAKLMNIRPEFANVKRQGQIIKVDPEEVTIGETILIQPGEKFPLDGSVIQGMSMVDTSALTGESLPRKLEKGSEALSGFVNGNSALEVKVEKSYQNSTVAKILELVEDASSRKAPTEKFITKFARYYTPVVVFSALALAIFPALFFGQDFYTWIYRALVFLVISCPCALVVSIPLGFFGGIGGASKQGILVKGGNYLEALNSVSTLVFDKTGTLTQGVFEVQDIQVQEGFNEEEVLAFAAHGESQSTHPIAKSIVDRYGKEIDSSKIENYEEIPGHGIKAKISGSQVLLGNMRLMEKEGISLEENQVFGTIIYMAIEGKYAGFILISDRIKEDAKSTIQGLKDLGIEKTVLLTGDHKNIAEKIGRDLGLQKVYSQLLPKDKVHKIEEMEEKKTKGETIAYVGDGINDAPVLARADIGIAMGGLGSDAAIEAADVVIMTDEPSKVVTAIKIARRTRKIVMQNIVFALGIKAIFLLLGALGLASMWAAVFADTGVTLIAVLNSLRALYIKE